MVKRVYLAGPEVFCPDPLGIGAAKKEMCRRYGFEGLYPMDTPVDHALPPRELGIVIMHADEMLMEQADFCIANITPFRGVSADVGTAMEVGWFRARRKPVFAYTNVPEPLTERVRQFFGGELMKRSDGVLADPEGNMIEGFEMTDNPMIEVPAIDSAGGIVIMKNVPHGYRFTDLAGFERCLLLAQTAGL